jgi:hypothetical protein
MVRVIAALLMGFSSEFSEAQAATMMHAKQRVILKEDWYDFIF